MEETVEEDGFMEMSVLRNGMKRSHCLLDDKSVGRREIGVPKIMPADQGSPGS